MRHFGVKKQKLNLWNDRDSITTAMQSKGSFVVMHYPMEVGGILTLGDADISKETTLINNVHAKSSVKTVISYTDLKC